MAWLFVAGIIVGFIAGYLWTSSKYDQTEEVGEMAEKSQETDLKGGKVEIETPGTNSGQVVTPPTTDTSAPKASTSESVTVEDQIGGETVMVKMSGMTSDRWIAVHELDETGNPGWVLGASLFRKGATEGTVELIRGTEAGKKYSVVIHSEDGDGAFSLRLDLPVLRADGSLVASTFTAQ